jgi:methionyl-tRNA formyltransferase
MKFVYFGSSVFSRGVLQAMCGNGVMPVLVISQADKPKGRGLVSTSTQISTYASSLRLPLLKPDSFGDESLDQRLKLEAADFFVVADYGKIIPARLLNLPKFFFLCAHPSLLPAYRGPSPVQRALMNGDSVTGSTIFKINDKIDSGEMLASQTYQISPWDDAVSLTQALALQSGNLLIKVMTQVMAGEYSLSVQDEAKATYAPKLIKKDGRIDWSKDAVVVNNLIRSVAGWPSAYTVFKGKTLKVLAGEPLSVTTDAAAGTIVSLSKDGLDIACGKDCFRLRRLVPEGKREMDAHAFAIGHGVKIGDKVE